MLYYRIGKSGTIKYTRDNIMVTILVILVWSSWFVSEIPFVLNFHQPSPIVFKGSTILSTSPDMEGSLVPDISFIEPAVGVLTSPYGTRWGRLHEGIDIGGEHGSEILAADTGVVKLSQWVDGYGNYIEIEHNNGFTTAYGHCDELLVSEGDSVLKGQSIATMGNTGNSTGPHLHFEVLHHGKPQNPLDYVIY